MYLFLCLSLQTHTNKQHNKTHTDTGSSVAGYDVMKENDGKKHRKRRKKKEENEVINVHYAQFREMKRMEKMREFVLFFGCAQWQSISNSVQIRAANICRTWYVVIFYIFLSILHTQIQ